MIGVAHPIALSLLVLAPLAGWWAVRRRRSAIVYPSLSLVEGLPGGRARWAVWGIATIRTLAVAGLALAAANPRTPDHRTRLSAEGIALVLVLDVSGSMGETDYGHDAAGKPVSRLEAAKRVLRLFVAGGEADGVRFAGRSQDQLGLVAFAAVPRTVCPLTLNHSVLLTLADNLTPATGVDAGTNLGDALAEGLLRLEAAGDRRKVLVVLSDGESNTERAGPNTPLKPRQAAQLATNLRIPVHCIDCGGEPMAAGNDETAKQRADGRRVLEAVANLTGGRLLTANDPAGLRAAYAEMDALETAPAMTFRYRRYHNYGPACGLLGVGLLAIGSLLEATWWRRRP